MIYDNMVVIE